MAEGKPKAMSVKGVGGSRSFRPDSIVWGCIRTCLLG